MLSRRSSSNGSQPPGGRRSASGLIQLGSSVLGMVVAVGLFADGAKAAGEVTASYGVLGKRALHATVVVTGVNRRARAVLETRGAGARPRTRRRRSRIVRAGRAKLSWTYPKSARRLVVRVRILPRRGRQQTLAVGEWKTLPVSGLRPTAPVAAVRPNTVLAAPAPGLPGDLVIAGRANVKVADVVAVGFGPATPDGLLAKAVTVTRSGPNTVVSTQPATLPEVIGVGELDLQLPAEKARTSAASPFQRVQKALQCSNGREAVASGGASVAAGASLKARWRWRGFQKPPTVTGSFSGNVSANLEAAASISSEASCALERQPLFASPVRLHQFATSIGPIPVYVVVDGQVYFSGAASVTGKIETSVKASSGVTAGVEFDGQQFKPFGRMDRSILPQPPTVSASGSVEASLAPAAYVRLYGVGGPEIDFTAGLKLAADLTPAPGDPWWRLTAPLELGVKFRLLAIKGDLESERFSVWSEEPELLRATTPPSGSTIQDAGLSPTPLPEGIRTRLVWDSNTDVDLHTWDHDGNHSYFADTGGIDSGFLDQDVIPGFGPETFQETDPGHAFTFGVCQYSGTQANVTVDVRDPDGLTRRFLVTLRGRKAASLMTISPANAVSHVPSSGWCNRLGSDPVAIGESTTGTFE